MIQEVKECVCVVILTGRTLLLLSMSIEHGRIKFTYTLKKLLLHDFLPSYRIRFYFSQKLGKTKKNVQYEF